MFRDDPAEKRHDKAGGGAIIVRNPGAVSFRSQKGVCGEISVRNNAGGDTGYHRFVLVPFDGEKVVVEDSLGLEIFNDIWNIGCEENAFLWDTENNKWGQRNLIK